jgi:hypothetical protein
MVTCDVVHGYGSLIEKVFFFIDLEDCKVDICVAQDCPLGLRYVANHFKQFLYNLQGDFKRPFSMVLKNVGGYAFFLSPELFQDAPSTPFLSAHPAFSVHQVLEK